MRMSHRRALLHRPQIALYRSRNGRADRGRLLIPVSGSGRRNHLRSASFREKTGPRRKIRLYRPDPAQAVSKACSRLRTKRGVSNNAQVSRFACSRIPQFAQSPGISRQIQHQAFVGIKRIGDQFRQAGVDQQAAGDAGRKRRSGAGYQRATRPQRVAAGGMRKCKGRYRARGRRPDTSPDVRPAAASAQKQGARAPRRDRRQRFEDSPPPSDLPRATTTRCPARPGERASSARTRRAVSYG